MALFEEQITDTLETGAPPIKYEGDEGPKSPQEERMVQLKEEYMSYVFEMKEIGEPILSFEEWYQMTYEASKMGVDARQQPQPMMRQPQPQMRQPVAYGGIMGLGGRRQYGIGSSIKKRIRKLIPNEAARIAEVAAPFVAPFNPLIGGLMSGFGGFDRHGSLSKGIKSGLINYAMGNVAREMGGADSQWGLKAQGTGSGLGSYFTSPTSGAQLWGASKAPPSTWQGGTPSVYPTDVHAAGTSAGAVSDAVTKAASATKDTKGLWNTIKKFGLDNKAIIGILGGAAAAGLYTAKNPAEDSIKQMRGEGIDVESIRTEVTEAFKDPTGEKLKAIRIKYPFLGAKETKNIDIMAEGGRAGYYAGGQSTPSDYTMEDARKTSMQDKMGGITDVMKHADLYRQGDVGQIYAADGGRIGYGLGSWVKSKLGLSKVGGSAQASPDRAQVTQDPDMLRSKVFDLFKNKFRGGEGSNRFLGQRTGSAQASPDRTQVAQDPDMMRGKLFNYFTNKYGGNDWRTNFRNQWTEPFIQGDLDEDEEEVSYAQGGRIGYAGGSGRPPVTIGQPIQAPQPMPGPQAPQTPMPAPQPNQLGRRMNPMMGGMNPMMGGMNPMMGGMNPMMGGMNPMMNRPMMGGMNPMMGGRRMAQEGGLMDLGGMEKDYRQEGGFVPLGGKEKADDVPARLSKNEFVFTADAVRGAGGGDIDKGAEIMENMMKNLEQGGQISEETQGLGGAQEMFDVSERLSEVV